MHEILGTLYVCEKCGGQFVYKWEAKYCESLREAKVSGIKEGMVVKIGELSDASYLVLNVYTSSKSLVGKTMKKHVEYATIRLVRMCDTHVRDRDVDGATFVTETSNLTKYDAEECCR